MGAERSPQLSKVQSAVLFKQWGGVQKKKNGRKLRGKTYDEFPFTASASMPERAARRVLAANLGAQFLIAQ